MNDIVVRFTNKLNRNESTQEMQIEQATPVESLGIILTTLLARKSEYFFYFKNERIVTTLSSMIEKWKVSAEEVMEVEFIDTRDTEADRAVDCEDTVLALVDFGESIFYFTLGGQVLKIDKYWRKQGESSTPSLVREHMQGIFGSDSLYGFTEHSIIDLQSLSDVYTSNDRIKECISNGSEMAVITSESIVYLCCSGDKIIAPAGFNARSIQLFNGSVMWIEEYDLICIFNLTDQKMETYKLGVGLTSIRATEQGIAASSANGKLGMVSEGSVRYLEVPFRFTSKIAGSGGLVACASQRHVVIAACGGEYTEKAIFKVSGQIQAIALCEGMLCVANDRQISFFDIKFLC